jgi:predicted RNA-binding Zn ribbon-like protein
VSEVQGQLPRRLSGRLCLDFTNTVDPRHGAARRDYLPDYDALLAWFADATAPSAGRDADVGTDLAGTDLAGTGLVGTDLVERLARRARTHRAEAASVWRAAVGLREDLYAVSRVLLDGARPDDELLQRVVTWTQAAVLNQHLQPSAGSLTWAWRDVDRLDLPLLAVALDAGDLLTSADLHRLRECPGSDGCGWLFLDQSRGGTRRWCSMRVCGNRNKINRYRSQRQPESTG